MRRNTLVRLAVSFALTGVFVATLASPAAAGRGSLEQVQVTLTSTPALHIVVNGTTATGKLGTEPTQIAVQATWWSGSTQIFPTLDDQPYLAPNFTGVLYDQTVSIPAGASSVQMSFIIGKVGRNDVTRWIQVAYSGILSLTTPGTLATITEFQRY